jgi:hypothetical protein
VNQPAKEYKVKNIPSQQYILKHPTQFISDLTNAEYTVLNTALASVAHYGNGVLFNQTYLGEREGFTTRTVNRAVAKFKKLGLFIVKQRREGCAYLSITNYFSFPLVRIAISHMFSKYPAFRIRLSMLLSEYVLTEKRETSCPDSQLFRIGLNRISENERRANRDKKVNEVTIRKILDIERALVARGESLETMDTEKLAAFSEECLDSVSAQMKKAHPKKPFGFFLHLCMQWCKENNQEPVFAKADALRQLNLLAKFREKSRPASISEQIKTAGEQKKPDYAQQVRQEMQRERQAADARTRRYNAVELVEEIAGLKRQIEDLTERAATGNMGMVASLLIAKGTLARREYELASMTPNSAQISTETKVPPISHTNTAPPTQIVQHMSNLFMDGFIEDSDDEDVLD